MPFGICGIYSFASVKRPSVVDQQNLGGVRPPFVPLTALANRCEEPDGASRSFVQRNHATRVKADGPIIRR